MKQEMNNERVKVYLSGQISGLDDAEARRLFKKYEAEVVEMLKNEGVSDSDYIIVNPMELPQTQNTWQSYMLRDLTILMDCTIVVMLPNWKESVGARIERLWAQKMGIPVMWIDNEAAQLPHAIEDQKKDAGIKELCTERRCGNCKWKTRDESLNRKYYAGYGVCKCKETSFFELIVYNSHKPCYYHQFGENIVSAVKRINGQ